MVNIPSDITQVEDARHWCRVNGYSAEATESMVAEWMGNPAPVVEPEVELDASPEPEVEEGDDEDEDWEDEDWEDEEEYEDEE